MDHRFLLNSAMTKFPATAVLIVTFFLWAHPLWAQAEAPVHLFNGQRAFEHVRNIVSFGPRPPGSNAIKEAQKYIDEVLRSSGLAVRQQDFIANTPLGPIEMRNIIGIVKGLSDDFLAVGGHYDTKLFRDFKFVGANDGGSSAGLLLELAKVWGGTIPPLTLWIVFFDGEEALLSWSESDSLYGSRFMARNISSSGELSRMRAMIVVDMIGDSDLNLQRDSYSNPMLVERIWATARYLGYEQFFPQTEAIPIEDDHLPFARLGVPSALLIDFSYGGRSRPGPFWHTAEDTLDKLSPDSLQILGQVVSTSVEELMREISGPPGRR